MIRWCPTCDTEIRTIMYEEAGPEWCPVCRYTWE